MEDPSSIQTFLPLSSAHHTMFADFCRGQKCRHLFLSLYVDSPFPNKSDNVWTLDTLPPPLLPSLFSGSSLLAILRGGRPNSISAFSLALSFSSWDRHTQKGATKKIPSPPLPGRDRPAHMDTITHTRFSLRPGLRGRALPFILLVWRMRNKTKGEHVRGKRQLDYASFHAIDPKTHKCEDKIQAQSNISV